MSVKVYDNAGLMEESPISTEKTPIANTAPIVEEVIFVDKTTNSITVSARATDAEDDNLVYRLYVDGTLKATSGTVSAGSMISLTANGLSEYTLYGLKVEAQETSTSERYIGTGKRTEY